MTAARGPEQPVGWLAAIQPLTSPEAMADERRCSGSLLLVAAVELRPEESRCALEDLCGPSQLPVLTLQRGDPARSSRVRPARVPCSISSSMIQRRKPLPVEPQLFGNRCHLPAIADASGVTPLPHQPHSPLPKIVRVHPQSYDALHPSCTERSLRRSRGGSRYQATLRGVA